MKGQLRSDILISNVPNLQRLVYDVDIALGATEGNLTQAHSLREVVIKCHCMIVGHPAVRVTLSSHCYRTASYKDGTTSVRMMKSTDLTS